MPEHYPVKLDWFCNCRDGKCVYEGADHHRCVSMTADEEALVLTVAFITIPIALIYRRQKP